ncbi:MAG: hypothetical protein LBG72_05390, partial [Spirochaetaceae bacterium]|nr:hypothetical protein [Spirochaetaceae bacterium]
GTAGVSSTNSRSETVAVDDGVIFYTSNDKITSYKLLGRPEKQSIPIVKEGGEEYKINWKYSMSMTYLYILLFPITVPVDLVTAFTRSDGSRDLVKELQEAANQSQQGVGKEKNIAIGIITYSMWKANRKKFLASS